MADGSSLPEGVGEEVDFETQVSVAREIALRQLTVRARSTEELRQALAKRKVPKAAADAVLRRFGEVGLIDDTAFAQAWVESGKRRLRGPRAMALELRRKGVAEDVVSAAVAEVSAADELAAAQELAEKKLRTLSGVSRQAAYRRLAGALARRGFAAGVISQVVRQALGEWEE
jgi:regulatory protein